MTLMCCAAQGSPSRAPSRVGVCRALEQESSKLAVPLPGSNLQSQDHIISSLWKIRVRAKIKEMSNDFGIAFTDPRVQGAPARLVHPIRVRVGRQQLLDYVFVLPHDGIYQLGGPVPAHHQLDIPVPHHHSTAAP
eukprot:CAMPEP_0194528864 /NCGR_PEP_ID=MMETSP0253-20130528/65367_1 /TAXON_ID=2966 /ORGANISM="Noctiluca scintillans" /LENGTH=134 /DNA_ID=CAMNT_0039373953 /DNA_START=551 /DNA_END=951 /DNA_ORIENTATION=-